MKPSLVYTILKHLKVCIIERILAREISSFNIFYFFPLELEWFMDLIIGINIIAMFFSK